MSQKYKYEMHIPFKLLEYKLKTVSLVSDPILDGIVPNNQTYINI